MTETNGSGNFSSLLEHFSCTAILRSFVSWRPSALGKGSRFTLGDAKQFFLGCGVQSRHAFELVQLVAQRPERFLHVSEPKLETWRLSQLDGLPIPAEGSQIVSRFGTVVT